MDIRRTRYLEAVAQWKDTQVIKVITGIRRCGKSTLLRQYQEVLAAQGVSGEQIISINFEDLAFEELLDYKALHHHIKSRLVDGRMNYIFLDEIQRVVGFEKAVDSLYILDNVDLYITGSNSYMLSGELATLLSGRYIEIFMLPFSFSEYYKAFGEVNADDAFSLYLRDGGFPYTCQLERQQERIHTYLEGIYNTIIVKDIEAREQRRNAASDRRKVNDFSLLRDIARFLASSIGSPISYKSITDYIISAGRRVSQNTVSDYVEMLREAFVFYPVERFDIAGKQLLKNNHKIYIVDSGLRRYLLPRKTYDLGFVLENTVYLELLRRGNRVCIGKLGATEVDFVVQKDDEFQYIQVTASLTEQSTFEREIKPLRAIRDHHPKVILTLDRYTPGNYDGIRVINLIDWLLDD